MLNWVILTLTSYTKSPSVAESSNCPPSLTNHVHLEKHAHNSMALMHFWSPYFTWNGILVPPFQNPGFWSPSFTHCCSFGRNPVFWLQKQWFLGPKVVVLPQFRIWRENIKDYPSWGQKSPLLESKNRDFEMGN